MNANQNVEIKQDLMEWLELLDDVDAAFKIKQEAFFRLKNKYNFDLTYDHTLTKELKLKFAESILND